MVLYLVIGFNVALFILLLRSMLMRDNDAEGSQYKHAVKRLFENNPEIKKKWEDKFKP